MRSSIRRKNPGRTEHNLFSNLLEKNRNEDAQGEVRTEHNLFSNLLEKNKNNCSEAN
jgi:hypothetical protein